MTKWSLIQALFHAGQANGHNGFVSCPDTRGMLRHVTIKSIERGENPKRFKIVGRDMDERTVEFLVDTED